MTWNFPRAATDDFVILALPKVGTTSIVRWREENNIENVPNEEKWWRSKGRRYETKDVFFIWRPPYERLLTGLNTAFNTLAWDIVQRDSPELRHAFRAAFDDFIIQHDFNSNENISDHTRLMSDSYLRRLSYVHLDQLDIFHTYLNKRYDQNYTPFPKINRGDKSDSTRKHVSTINDFKLLLKSHPQTSLAINARAAQDFLPNTIINVNEL